MNADALFVGCPYCEWGQLVTPDFTTADAASSMLHDRDYHILRAHGAHAVDALTTFGNGGVLVIAEPHAKYDPLMFKLLEGTLLTLDATCQRCSWQVSKCGPKVDPLTKTLSDCYLKHQCTVFRQEGLQTIKWRANPPMYLRLKLTIHKPSMLAPPTKDSDAVTWGQVMQQSWERRQGEDALREQEDTVNEEATPDPAPIPPWGVVQSYVENVQTMTSELARLMGSAGPERHEHYSWAITQLVSARDALKDLRAQL